MNKLSQTQQLALEKIKQNPDVWHCACDLQISLSTLRALERKGFLTSKREEGSSWFPRLCIKYKLINR